MSLTSQFNKCLFFKVPFEPSHVSFSFPLNQVRAMIQILQHFGWTWAGLLVSDDDYGLYVARSFKSDLAQSGRGCLAYLEVLPWGDNPSELQRIVGVIKKSTARVVIVFAHLGHMIQLMDEVSVYPSVSGFINELDVKDCCFKKFL